MEVLFASRVVIGIVASAMLEVADFKCAASSGREHGALCVVPLQY